MLWNSTVVVSPWFRNWILACLTMLLPFGCTIVRVTGTESTCELPEFCTVTWKDIDAVTTMVVCVEVLSSWPDGSTFVETMLVPRRPPVVPVVAPRSRSRTDVIALIDARSPFWRKFELDTSGPPWSFVPVMPCCLSSASAGLLKESSQITSLAMKRCICEASALAALVVFLIATVAPNALARPFSPLTRYSSAWVTA